MTTPTDALLRLERVSKSYRSAGETTPVLAELDLTLRRGEITCLLGPSGAGKSTLLAVIAGLLLPDAGRVEFDGQDLIGLSDRRRARLRARRIGVVMQDANLVPFLTAAENVRLVARLAGTGMGRQHATALLGQVGVGERARHLPRRLSGGEAQRTALAVGLANSPDLLLADEVVGQLDSHTARLILDVLRQGCAERGLSVLLVTHDRAIAQLGHRALSLVDGRLEPAA